MTDATLRSDFHFLQDVWNAVDNSKRLKDATDTTVTTATDTDRQQTSQRGRRNPSGRHTNNNAMSPNIPHALLRIGQSINDDNPNPTNKDTNRQNKNQNQRPRKRPRRPSLVEVAALQGIQVLTMPSMMERAKTNRSHVAAVEGDRTLKTLNEPKYTIRWTVEWKLYDLDTTSKRPFVLSRHMTHNVDPNVDLYTIVPLSQLQSTTTTVNERRDNSNQTIPSLSCEDLTLLLAKLPTPANQPLFVKLSTHESQEQQPQPHDLLSSCTLATALTDMTVLEYPTIHVVPSTCLAYFPLAIQELMTRQQPQPEITTNDGIEETK